MLHHSKTLKVFDGSIRGLTPSTGRKEKKFIYTIKLVMVKLFPLPFSVSVCYIMIQDQ